MFQGLGNLSSLWKQASQLSGQFEKLGEELKKRRTTGTSGGGMVEIELNGALEVLRCKIDPQLVAGGDRELLEDLLVAAMNQAVTKGRQLHAELRRKKSRAACNCPACAKPWRKSADLGPKEP